jgi:hypothetical protein
MAKSKKKLWCVSFKHEDMESEAIYHVRALTRSKAESIATETFLNNQEIYEDNEEQFEFELENGILSVIAFEVINSEILE